MVETLSLSHTYILRSMDTWYYLLPSGLAFTSNMTNNIRISKVNRNKQGIKLVIKILVTITIKQSFEKKSVSFLVPLIRYILIFFQIVPV